jgi:hypothetical protein
MKFAALALLVATVQAADPVCVKSAQTFTDKACTKGVANMSDADVKKLNDAQVKTLNCTADGANSYKYTCAHTGGSATYFMGNTKCTGNGTATVPAGGNSPTKWTAGGCTDLTGGKWAKIVSGVAKPVVKKNNTSNTTKTNGSKNNTTKKNATNNSSGAQALAATFAASAALLATVY